MPVRAIAQHPTYSLSSHYVRNVAFSVRSALARDFWLFLADWTWFSVKFRRREVSFLVFLVFTRAWILVRWFSAVSLSVLRLSIRVEIEILRLSFNYFCGTNTLYVQHELFWCNYLMVRNNNQQCWWTGITEINNNPIWNYRPNINLVNI